MIAKMSRVASAVVVLAVVALATPGSAQQIPGGPVAQPQPQAQPKSKSPPAAKAAPKENAAAAGGSDGQLRQRVEQLEEQLVDMQVVVGTLESLARSGGGGAAAPAGRSGGAGLSSAEAGRLDGLETQIRALTAQLEQLAEQVRATQSGQGQRQGSISPAPIAPGPGPRAAAAAPAAPSEPTPRFGSQTVTPAPQSSDPIGGLLGDGNREPAAGRPAQAAAGATDGSPKQLYETAYGYLLQQDYGAAEAAFTDFLQRYPSDPLAGNAQYWLGESFYVRGNYKSAAGSFLKGYQTYARSAKAPESLLKLAMSLDRLGQRDAACTSYGELAQKFPNAPAHVKNRAVSERARIGCA